MVFKVNEYGKPFLDNYDDDVYFNISHSGKWLVCCIDFFQVGIDIEATKHINMCLAERVFSKNEFESLILRNIFEREDFFFELWTLKESYIKAVGKGLSIPLDSFTMKMNKGNITVCSVNESEDYYFRQYNLDENYKMAVCARKNEFSDKVIILDMNVLYEAIGKANSLQM